MIKARSLAKDQRSDSSHVTDVDAGGHEGESTRFRQAPNLTGGHIVDCAFDSHPDTGFHFPSDRNLVSNVLESTGRFFLSPDHALFLCTRPRIRVIDRLCTTGPMVESIDTEFPGSAPSIALPTGPR